MYSFPTQYPSQYPLQSFQRPIQPSQYPIQSFQRPIQPSQYSTQYQQAEIQAPQRSIQASQVVPQIIGLKQKFTSEDIKKYYDNLLRNLNESKLYEPIKQQKIKEAEIILKHVVCKEFAEVHEKLSNLNPKEIEELITEQFYSYEVMQSLACILSSIYSQKMTSAYYRHFITELRYLSGNTSGGNVMFASLKNQSRELFVLKSPKSLSDHDDLIHEIFVGFYGTNQLRKLIPNFAYVYGYISCSLPFIKNDKVSAWCDPNLRNVTYAIYENIVSDISSTKYMKSITVKEFFIYLLQILYSLKIAYEAIDFTHYDLHSNNVIIKKLNGKRCIKYGDEIYIETDIVATIIDYGRSHIKYNGVDFGHVDSNSPMAEHDIKRDSSNILYDVYKHYMAINVDIFNGNKSTFNQIKDIFKYFNDKEDLSQALQNQIPFYYNTVPRPEFDINNFIEFVVNYAKNLGFNIITKSPTSKVLRCENNCPSFENILYSEKVSSNNTSVVPNNYLEFYDLYTYYTTDESKKLLLENFDVNTATIELDNKINEIYTSMVVPTYIFSVTYDYVNGKICDIARYLEKLQELKFYKHITYELNNISLNDKISKMLDNQKTNIQEYSDWIDHVIDIFIDNSSYESFTDSHPDIVDKIRLLATFLTVVK